MNRPALLLSPVVPDVGGGGLAMRTGLFLEALSRRGPTDLAVLPLFGPAERTDWARRIARQVEILPLAGRSDTRLSLLMRTIDPAARRAAFADYGLPTLAGRLPVWLADEIVRIFSGTGYDLVHATRGYMAPLALALAQRLGTRATIDLDESDSAFHRRQMMAQRRAGNEAAALWSGLEAAAYDRLQARCLPGFQTVFISSRLEAGLVGALAAPAPVWVTPNGLSRPRRLPDHSDGQTLLFVGTLGYEPNADGLDWFLRRIWPKLTRRCRVKLLVVGRGAPQRLLRLMRRPGVEYLGGVDDLAAIYRQATVVVAPILAAGGTRIKIIEAAFHGVPVVATPLAAEGLDLRDGRDIDLAATADQFVSRLWSALSHRALRQRHVLAAQRQLAPLDRATVVRTLGSRLAELPSRD